MKKLIFKILKRFGIETTWKYKFAENFAFAGSFTYQDHEITKSDSNPAFEGNELGRQPKVLGTLGVDYDDSGFDGSFVYNYTGKKFTNDSNSIELDAIRYC